jgi:hypothetical protein
MEIKKNSFDSCDSVWFIMLMCLFLLFVCFIKMWFVLTFVAFVYLSKDIEFIYSVMHP